MSQRSQGFFWCQNTGNLSEKAPAHLLPFGNLPVIKPQSLELHSVKNGFGRRRFDNAGRRSLRLYQKAFANERIRIVHNGSDHRVFRKIVSSESAVGSNRFLRALGSSVPETGDRSNIGACPNLSAL